MRVEEGTATAPTKSLALVKDPPPVRARRIATARGSQVRAPTRPPRCQRRAPARVSTPMGICATTRGVQMLYQAWASSLYSRCWQEVVRSGCCEPHAAA